MMGRQKGVRISKRDVVWLFPLLILGIGALPDVAESAWWTALGFILFIAVIVALGWTWYEAGQGRDKRIEMESAPLDRYFEERAG